MGILTTGIFLFMKKKLLIDFDDIELGFFVNDLAIFLDHVCDVKDEKLQTKERIEFVFSNLMKGYKEILSPDSNLIAQIPLFMKFRWIMNHCLTQLIHGDQLQKDEKHIGFHANRVEMFGNDFKKLDYLYKFDFEDTYRKL